MKKIVSLLLAAIMAVSLAGCASPLNPSSAEPGYPDENGNAEGYLNDTMHTYFFDYTVTNAYVCNEFEGYVPSGEGKELVVAEVTIKNTAKSTTPMFDTDFQIQWGDNTEDAFDFPITFYLRSTDNVSDKMFPAEYSLGVNESRSGLLVFEVPTGKKDFSISYLEEFDDDTTGNVFFVYFTPSRQ